MATVTKKELVERIAEQSGLKRQEVRRVVQSFLDEVINELGRGNRLEFRDFGVFDVRERAERIAQNPKTLERVTVPAKRTARFRVGRLMKACVDEGTTVLALSGADRRGDSEE
ncbi:MAG: HU family DNA-binding protein [Phycisphaerales bacterium]|jgi:integration host factor subunit beta